MEGDIEKVERTMRVSEIRVRYRLPISEGQRETAQRVLELHPSGCPAYQTVKDAVRIKIDADFQIR